MVASNIDPARSDALATAARDKWDMALRARRLATAALNRDRETLISYAEELERETEVLEKRSEAHQHKQQSQR